MTTPEGRNVEYLTRRCKELGFEQRKVSWEGRVGAPDRLILAPLCAMFVELKAPGKKARVIQQREIDRLLSAGLFAAVASTPEEIEDLLSKMVEISVKNCIRLKEVTECRERELDA